MKLVLRTDLQSIESGCHYYAEDAKGNRWSVVNIGELLSEMPKDLKYFGMFLGWEAIKLTGNDELDDDMERADTWEDLEKILDNYSK